MRWAVPTTALPPTLLNDSGSLVDSAHNAKLPMPAHRPPQKAAQAIKDGLDKKFGPTWHCVVGEGFGFNITFNHQHMLYMYYQEKLGILIFKC